MTQQIRDEIRDQIIGITRQMSLDNPKIPGGWKGAVKKVNLFTHIMEITGGLQSPDGAGDTVWSRCEAVGLSRADLVDAFIFAQPGMVKDKDGSESGRTKKTAMAAAVPALAAVPCKPSLPIDPIDPIADAGPVSEPAPPVVAPVAAAPEPVFSLAAAGESATKKTAKSAKSSQTGKTSKIDQKPVISPAQASLF